MADFIDSEAESAPSDDPERPYLHAGNNPIAAYADFEDRHWWFLARRRILSTLVADLLPAANPSLILDVGCGPGETSHHSRPGIDAWGLTSRRRQSPLPGPDTSQVEFVQGLAPLDVPDVAASANLLLAMDLLEHLEQPDRLIGDLVAAARPGPTCSSPCPPAPSCGQRTTSQSGIIGAIRS